MKKQRFIGLLVEGNKKLAAVMSKLECDGYIAYNGKVPHKLLHITVKVPEWCTSIHAATKADNLSRNLPAKFTVLEAYQHPYTTKIMLSGVLDKKFSTAVQPHVTIGDFGRDYDAKDWAAGNKELLQSCINTELKVIGLAVITKNEGVTYKSKQKR